ncbi:M55 family metallopeptidase [bacterium]|nr:M55 family metallopeptidase [bacterium]
MRVLITTDLEGVSGIVNWDNHEPRTPLDVWQRKLMTGEVNAAVAAAFDAGATEVKIAEGHNAIDILQLDSRAILIPAVWPAVPIYQGWDEGYDALLQIGKHAMENTPKAVLCHSYSHKAIEWLKINGELIGEIGVEAAEAGEYGFPFVMISGDEAACQEGLKYAPGAEIAPVKKGYALHHTACLSPEAARKMIYQKVSSALSRLDAFELFRIPGPIEMLVRRKEPMSPETIAAENAKPFTEVLDEFTVRVTGRTVVETMAHRCGLDWSWPVA